MRSYQRQLLRGLACARTNSNSSHAAAATTSATAAAPLHPLQQHSQPPHSSQLWPSQVFSTLFRLLQQHETRPSACQRRVCHPHPQPAAHRCFAAAAAAPARAAAASFAAVAQRKLAAVQQQYDALQAKLEGAGVCRRVALLLPVRATACDCVCVCVCSPPRRQHPPPHNPRPPHTTRRAPCAPLKAGTPPGSEAYQRLSKEAAALLPLVEGYQQLQAKQADVRAGVGCAFSSTYATLAVVCARVVWCLTCVVCVEAVLARATMPVERSGTLTPPPQRAAKHTHTHTHTRTHTHTHTHTHTLTHTRCQRCGSC
jgi:hypothetical protein